MPINFTDTFWTTDGRNLQRPNLACLRMDAETYDVLLFQIREAFSYDNTGIWITDRDRAYAKFYSFFILAEQRESELVITPEYSCPWGTLGQVLDENRFPRVENVWIVGCQSITPRGLREFMDARPGIIWITDRDLVDRKFQTDPEQFFDPVCILFNTTNAAGQVCKVGIIQFKTEMFGGEGYAWERDNSIRGTTCYVISNSFASINLVAMICSDALTNPLDFNYIQNGFFFNSPLLLVHIQLNQHPFGNIYKTYRNQLFARGDKNFPKEIICLNWGWHLPDDTNGEGYWNHYGGSAFYIKSDKLDLRDARFNRNHHYGLYYNRWDKSARAHIYFLSYDEYVFRIRTTKASQIAANPAQYMRTGPEVRQLYMWDNDWVIADRAIQYFGEACAEVEEGYGVLTCLSESDDYINVERLVNLCAGNISFEKSWFTPSKLKTLEIGDDEINFRVTFIQDPSDPPKEKRRQLLLYYATIKYNIILKPENLNSRLTNIELRYDIANPVQSNDDFLFNLHSTIDDIKGTGVYLGLTTQNQAQAVWDCIASMFNDSNMSGNLIVWYDHDGHRRKIDKGQQVPNFKENSSKSLASFKKTHE